MKYLIYFLALFISSTTFAADVLVAISPYQQPNAVNEQLKWLNNGFSKLEGNTPCADLRWIYGKTDCLSYHS